MLHFTSKTAKEKRKIALDLRKKKPYTFGKSRFHQRERQRRALAGFESAEITLKQLYADAKKGIEMKVLESKGIGQI